MLQSTNEKINFISKNISVANIEEAVNHCKKKSLINFYWSHIQIFASNFTCRLEKKHNHK